MFWDIYHKGPFLFENARMPQESTTRLPCIDECTCGWDWTNAESIPNLRHGDAEFWAKNSDLRVPLLPPQYVKVNVRKYDVSLGLENTNHSAHAHQQFCYVMEDVIFLQFWRIRKMYIVNTKIVCELWRDSQLLIHFATFQLDTSFIPWQNAAAVVGAETSERIPVTVTSNRSVTPTDFEAVSKPKYEVMIEHQVGWFGFWFMAIQYKLVELVLDTSSSLMIFLNNSSKQVSKF